MIDWTKFLQLVQKLLCQLYMFSLLTPQPSISVGLHRLLRSVRDSIVRGKKKKNLIFFFPSQKTSSFYPTDNVLDVYLKEEMWLNPVATGAEKKHRRRSTEEE